MRRQTFLIAGFVTSLILAGAASFYASSSPDGLEYVASQTGFEHTARDSATADGPLADYQATGVDDKRLSGGLAGVIGTSTVALIAGGLFWGLRRRSRTDELTR